MSTVEGYAVPLDDWDWTHGPPPALVAPTSPSPWRPGCDEDGYPIVVATPAMRAILIGTDLPPIEVQSITWQKVYQERTIRTEEMRRLAAMNLMRSEMLSARVKAAQIDIAAQLAQAQADLERDTQRLAAEQSEDTWSRAQVVAVIVALVGAAIPIVLHFSPFH